MSHNKEKVDKHGKHDVHCLTKKLRMTTSEYQLFFCLSAHLLEGGVGGGVFFYSEHELWWEFGISKCLESLQKG